jgi:hypothetical protein
MSARAGFSFALSLFLIRRVVILSAVAVLGACPSETLTLILDHLQK